MRRPVGRQKARNRRHPSLRYLAGEGGGGRAGLQGRGGPPVLPSHTQAAGWDCRCSPPPPPEGAAPLQPAPSLAGLQPRPGSRMPLSGEEQQPGSVALAEPGVAPRTLGSRSGVVVPVACVLFPSRSGNAVNKPCPFLVWITVTSWPSPFAACVCWCLCLNLQPEQGSVSGSWCKRQSRALPLDKTAEACPGLGRPRPRFSSLLTQLLGHVG